MCRCKAARAITYTGGGIVQERNLERRKARSDGPEFSTGTCQSLLMGNEKQKRSIGHRGSQSTFS